MTSATNAAQQTTVHICCPASPAGEDMPALGIASWPDLAAAVQREIGPTWQITGAADLIWAALDPAHGGRTDDDARAADLQHALADDTVRAIVALRGGAFLLRILDRIDLSVLQRRRTPVMLVGFSEWTCLSLVACRYPMALAVHHTSPMYMLSPDPANPLTPEQKQSRWQEIWSDIRALLEGRPPAHTLTGRLVAGRDIPAGPIRLYGGNLTLLAALAGTKYHDAARPDGAWLAIEDVNESIGRIDRKITQLRSAGLLDDLGGVLLGGFTSEGRDMSVDVAALLGLHLPATVPIVAECNFGHFWPAAAFPLCRPVRLTAPASTACDPQRSALAGALEVQADWASLL
jgi:muramoyltetrapeptide carboxypeptidase